jgi:16S rRNA (cytosine1402-N4)-methyltransferase
MKDEHETPYHIPVLREEVATYLITNPEGIYFDGTAGGGGHAEYIIKRLHEEAIYIAVDQDKDAINFIKRYLKNYANISIHWNNYTDIDSVLAKLKIEKIDGLFLDLGLSSHQIDAEDRGFSYLNSNVLDMRMNHSIAVSAKDLLNTKSESELIEIFRSFGEERKAKAISRRIVRLRKRESLTTTHQLKKIISEVVHPKYVIKSYARVFQALRIAVNHELENLLLILNKSISTLKSGGRLVVISYHSLEDRMVKHFLREKANPCICPPDFPECCCGRIPSFKLIIRKAVKPEKQEIESNTRARSAILRVGELL